MRQLKITKSITNRDSESLEKYLVEIGKYPLITVEEEVELAQQIKAGNKKAVNDLAKANLRFVVSVAKQYQNQGLGLQDLINEGNVGLITAAKKFDETRGFKFISYAVWWIRQAIMQAISENSRIVRLPLNQLSSISKLNKAKTANEKEFGERICDEELAEVLEVSVEKLHDIMHLATNGRHSSLDTPLGHDSDNTLYDVLEDHDAIHTDAKVMNESLKHEINNCLSMLSEREYIIIVNSFGLCGQPERTLDDIADDIGLTRERVRQIKEKSLKRISLRMKQKVHIREYL